MTISHISAHPSARRRRRIRSGAVLLALAAGLGATSSPASAAAAPTDRFTVCLPTPCMPISDAVVAGFAAWDANTITYRVTNPGLPVVTASFAEIDNGVVVRTQSVRVLRGELLSDVASVSPATDALRISLCPSASEAPLPNCAIGGAVR